MRKAIYNAPTGENVPCEILDTIGSFADVRITDDTPREGGLYRKGEEFRCPTNRLTNVSDESRARDAAFERGAKNAAGGGVDHVDMITPRRS